MFPVFAVFTAALIVGLGSSASRAASADVHAHGRAALELAVEDGVLLITLRVPAADAYGFEHAPRDASERAHVGDIDALLATPSRLFTPAPEADCVPEAVRVAGASAPEEHGHEHEHEHEEHSDVVVDYRYVCRVPGRLVWIDTGVFVHFTTIERIEAAVVTATGQTATTLARDAARLDLPAP